MKFKTKNKENTLTEINSYELTNNLIEIDDENTSIPKETIEEFK